MTKFWKAIYADSHGAVAYIDPSTPDELKHGPRGWVEALAVVRFTVDEPNMEDWTATDSLRLISTRLREVIDRDLGARDCVQWLPARVEDIVTGETTDWHVLHFPEVPQVVSEEYSVRVGPMIVKEVLDDTAVHGLSIFVTSPYSNGWVVSNALRRNIENAGCTGISFTPIRTVSEARARHEGAR